MARRAVEVCLLSVCLSLLLAMRASHAVGRPSLYQQETQKETNAEPDQASLDKSTAATAQKLIDSNDCKSCHATDHKVVGPSYSDIAKKYAGQPEAPAHLAKSVRDGGSGSWGNVPMLPHPNLKEEDLKVIISWILSLKAAAPNTENPNAKTYEYAAKDGGTVKLDFPLFVEGSNEKVTKDIFRGYELYDSYCYRCHGQDATESELAPDLKHSLNSGMTSQDFLSIAMAGRQEKGMPSWAGFFEVQEIKDIYMYVKGRSLDLIPVGRPPSEE